MKNKNFYNDLSFFYDEMISFSDIIKKRTHELKNFISYKYRDAADIGCGTGNDSVALAMNGLNVTGFDPSNGMIKQARINTEGFNVKLVVSGAEKIPTKFNNKFDIAISLGNSLANIEKKNISLSIKRIYSILKKNGLLIIQILNYTAVLKNNKRIVNITEKENNQFIRFYDFHKDNIIFNILKIDKTNLKNYDLLSTTLYPYKKEFLLKILKSAGFHQIKWYSDFNDNEFIPLKSKDLILTARKK